MRKHKKITRKKYKDHLMGKTAYRNQRKKKAVAVKHRQHKYKIVPISVAVIEIPSDKSFKLPRKRRSKNGTSHMYFTNITEQAIILYNKTEDLEEREIIFNTHILHPFQKLVENVFNTFKFSYFETGPQDVQKECLSHLVANMHKFDPSRCSKINPQKKATAFAYFSIIAKHYFILLNNTNYRKFQQNIEISDDKDENTVQLQQNDKYYVQKEMTDFIRLIIEFWEKNVDKIFTKQRDLNIANAVIELIRQGNNITLFNKKALYLYIREIADCHTQQITKVINKMKPIYNKIRQSYIEEGDINMDHYSIA